MERERCNGVICGSNCGFCGFRKAEMERRLKVGEWRKVYKRLRADTGEYVKIPKGAWTLVFKKGESNA